MSSKLAQPVGAACVVSVYSSPCAGEVGKFRGVFSDRLAAVEYVTQHYLDQNLSDDSTDMVLLKEWLKRHLLSLDGESFFEMYGTYDPTIDTLESFQQQIQENQEGTRFDHWFILSMSSHDTDSETDELDCPIEEPPEKKAKPD